MAKDIPPGAYLKDISARYNDLTIPRNLRTFSRLDPEMWGKVVVEEGEVELFVGEGTASQRCTPEQPGVIPVDTPFRLASTGKPARFMIEYYHEPKLADDDELASLLARAVARRRPSA